MPGTRVHLLRTVLCCLCLGSVAAGAATFDLQGHRGARGLAPENTLAAFDRGLAAGVSTLELDIAVTADGVPVVSHDLRLNPAIAREPSGRWIAAAGPAIHALPLAVLQSYDVGRLDPGSAYAASLPRQVPHDGERVPTLAALLAHLKDIGNLAVRLNVETKSDPRHPELAPAPEPLVTMILEVLRRAGIQDRVTLQSFDWRTLAVARRLAPGLPLSCLSTPQTLRDPAWTDGRRMDDFATAAAMAADAGCSIWSPAFAPLDAAQVADAHARGLQVLPWTVDRRDDMERMIDIGVDGLITDEPDVAAALLGERGISIGAAPRR